MICLYTVGHSSHPLDPFLDLLREHGISTLVDVRSRPYSKWAPHFSKDPLSRSLTGTGFEYVFLGHVLGGRPEDPRFYNRGRVDYALRAQAPDFITGIEELIERAEQRTTAILCAEEDPTRCHRRLLITSTLRHRGVQVLHIRADGCVQEEGKDLDPPSTQLSVFP